MRGSHAFMVAPCRVSGCGHQGVLQLCINQVHLLSLYFNIIANEGNLNDF